MPLQQSKVSKASVRSRKAAKRYRGLQPGRCPQCGAARMSHCVCPSCGTYKGRQVISVTSK